MFHDISVFTAAILEAWFAALLHGILSVSLICILSSVTGLVDNSDTSTSLVVDIFYIRLAISEGLKRRTDQIMCGLVLIQLLLSSAISALCLQQLIYGIESAPIPLQYFADQGRPANVAQTATCFLNNWIADSVLVWRLYLVCNKNKTVIIPYAIFITGSFAAGVGMLHAASTGNNLSKLFARTFAAWAETHWGLTVLTQLSASCLIAFKIWVVRNKATAVRSPSAFRSMPIVWMVLESGAILSFTTVILLSFYASHKIAGGVVGAISGQLAALIPSTILLMVMLNRVSSRSLDTPPPSTLVAIQQDLESAVTASSIAGHTIVHTQRSVDVQNDYELYPIYVHPSEKRTPSGTPPA